MTVPGVGTVECASEGGCSGTVEDGVVTITGDLKIVSVDPDLDSATAMVLAELAVDMLPVDPGPDARGGDQGGGDEGEGHRQGDGSRGI